MALPTAAIDRLFDRLAMSYGTEFTNKWGTLSSVDVKSHWAHELGIFVDNLHAIGWALKNLPDRCPNLIEFKTLCKQAPRPSTMALDAPKAPVEVVDRVLAEIAAKALQTPKDEFGNVDHKRWAKKLKARHEQGERLSLFQIRCYKSALDLLKETT
jgi:hypothetical protein